MPEMDTPITLDVAIRRMEEYNQHIGELNREISDYIATQIRYGLTA